MRTMGPGEGDWTGPALLRVQIRDEVRNAAHLAGGQLKLGQALGYDNGSMVSKLIKGTNQLTVERARTLDDWLTDHGWETVCGTPLEHLVETLRQALEDERAKQTDVFVACPMSAAGQDYSHVAREQAMGLVRALRKKDLRVYSAVEDIKTTSKFDQYDFAYRANLHHINSSRLFVLYLPQFPARPGGDDAAPSSVWIELGMALALGIPCTIFAPETTALPYIVRKAVQVEGSRAPVLDVQTYGDDHRKPAQWVKKHGASVLLGGDEL